LKSDQHAREALKHDIYKQDCSDHQLVVVGHSLGAGVAALLALHLRSVYPGTRCWAYAPPGGLMSPELSAAMRDYCTSVVCGRDLVPRLSLSNMEILARQMIECSARCKQPKVRVILHPGKKWKRDDLFKPEAEMSADARKTLEAYMRNSGSSHCAGGKVIEARDFLTPGKLLYYEVRGGRAITPPWLRLPCTRQAPRQPFPCIVSQLVQAMPENVSATRTTCRQTTVTLRTRSCSRHNSLTTRSLRRTAC